MSLPTRAKVEHTGQKRGGRTSPRCRGGGQICNSKKNQRGDREQRRNITGTKFVDPTKRRDQQTTERRKGKPRGNVKERGSLVQGSDHTTRGGNFEGAPIQPDTQLGLGGALLGGDKKSKQTEGGR